MKKKGIFYLAIATVLFMLYSCTSGKADNYDITLEEYNELQEKIYSENTYYVVENTISLLVFDKEGSLKYKFDKHYVPISVAMCIFFGGALVGAIIANK